MKKVIVCDAIHEKGFEVLAKEGIEVIDAVKLSKDELLKVMPQAEVAITRSSTDVDEKFLNASVNLKAIVRAGVGVDNVDLDACSKRGIIAMNVPTANTIAAVELTMAHLLSSARSLPQAHNHLKNERVWKRERWYGVELYGKKLGVIGFGNIGSRVAVRAKAFDMEVIAYDPYIPSSKVTDLGMEYTEDFNKILECDFITIHTPKNKETLGIIGANEIEKMKDGVRLINVARGGLYDELALEDGLRSGKVAYAGIDVFSYEPATDHPLLDMENICVTPHLGANTIESQEKIAIQAAEQAIAALRGTSYPNALNLPFRPEELPTFVAPYVELVQKMSYMAAQINKHPITSIKIHAEGNVAKYVNSMLTFALVGAFKESLGENINYVNAPFVAKDKGVNTDVIVEPKSGYDNKVTVKIATQKGITQISGTVFGENEQRIVNINGFKTDFKPKGKMIVFKNQDVPGVIMDISSILAQHRVNIADFRLGRDEHGMALAVILVDEAIDREILASLNALPMCIWAEYAVL